MIATEKVTVTLPTDLIAAVPSLAPARRQSQYTFAQKWGKDERLCKIGNSPMVRPARVPVSA